MLVVIMLMFIGLLVELFLSSHRMLIRSISIPLRPLIVVVVCMELLVDRTLSLKGG